MFKLCRVFAVAGATSLIVASTGHAAAINVLWTAGSDDYNTGIQQLATKASAHDPASNGALSWNLTMWDHRSDAKPEFSDYDVLVVGSTYGVDGDYSSGATGATGYFGLGVYASGVIANGAAISQARGTRTFLSGQDADWHHLNNRKDRQDGPEGFMINAVNWAGSGSGLGIVSMTDRYSSNVGWWTADGSFLKDELGDSVSAFNSNGVYIGAEQGAFPINEGLSSAGLSNWRTSSHAAFDEIAGYARINFTGPDSTGRGVTIVTAGREGGETDGGDDGNAPPVPLPAGVWLMLSALGALVIARRA